MVAPAATLTMLYFCICIAFLAGEEEDDDDDNDNDDDDDDDVYRWGCPGSPLPQGLLFEGVGDKPLTVRKSVSSMFLI